MPRRNRNVVNLLARTLLCSLAEPAPGFQSRDTLSGVDALQGGRGNFHAKSFQYGQIQLGPLSIFAAAGLVGDDVGAKKLAVGVVTAVELHLRIAAEHKDFSPPVGGRS